MFSNFECEFGYDDAGQVTYIQVPIRYGDASRNAQTMLQDASANNVPCSPMMSFYINELKYDRPRVQDPYFVDRKDIRQRTYNDTTELYETTQGNALTVERIMPVPYELGLTLDIWSSNTNMKLQILEQILPLFNPALEIQSTDNFLDWTSLSAVELIDTNWTSRSVPAGADDDIEISTLKFKLPIWISPPAKVTKQGVIHKIIANIYDDKGDMALAIQNDDILLGTRAKFTPHGYQLLLLDDQLQILEYSKPSTALNESLDVIDLQDSSIQWHSVIDEYGTLTDGISQIRLEGGDGSEVVGTVAYNPVDDNILIFTVDIDTIPSNTLDPVDAVINPLKSGPGSGLPAAVPGQRYLLTESIGDSTDSGQASGWEGAGNIELVANTNDIIEYNGNIWNVAWDASVANSREYVTNITTNMQYQWDLEAWVRSYEGIYRGGDWGLIL